MFTFARRAAALIVLPIAAAGAALAIGAAPATAATPAALQAQVVSLTNSYRAKAGCGAVRPNTLLIRTAYRHSWDMAQHGYFSHTSPGGSTFAARARYSGYNHAIGENIAWGYTSASTLVGAWMRSPGHRANILNCRARSVGVAVSYTRGGTPYWTQVFGGV
ncbi:MAG TPA: CAP domain-containing protein [Pilimelia sp.]|nr:CAP domain-containing protein [Pilimelia sp.]